jgi:hypothetical protein
LESVHQDVRHEWNNRQRLRQPAGNLARFLEYLQGRIESLRATPWDTFLSDRNVLPRYAFPIYNVPLVTPDPGLKLERDLRIALAEYAPGAEIVADGRLWESAGICLPPRRGGLPTKYYARCPRCWHIERALRKEDVFRDRQCPVCGHDGVSPGRPKRVYVVPKYGFSTDLQEDGRPVVYDRPLRIGASRVLFVPQAQDRPPDLVLGRDGSIQVSLWSDTKADFFVFNSGGDGSGLGFFLCGSCGRLLEDLRGSHQGTPPHQTFYGKQCRGSPSWRHLAHEFNGTATRLRFTGTNHGYEDHSFWLSLMYALLGGMAQALEIERDDIGGVIRPVRLGTAPSQEIVLFDDVPGGAGHVKRLLDREELAEVVKAAHERLTCCRGCKEDASCYACLRCYGNQHCHDLLQRGPAAEYLRRLLAALDPVQ